MSIVALSAAREHLRVEPDYPEAQFGPKLEAAEGLAAEYLSRRIFADEVALSAAVASVPATLTAASDAYAAARDAAYAIEDTTTQRAALEHANTVYRAAQAAARETYAGIVLNRPIEAAILMTLSSLHDQNRNGDALGLPPGARELLHPFRVGLGA